jgi:Glyoxalase-like domain
MASVVSSICLDCADPARLADFWSVVLGWPIKSRGWQRTPHGSDGVAIRSVNGIQIDFRWTPDTKIVKNRLHLDLDPLASSQADELERLLSLGATVVSVGQGEDATWRVLADPEGNEFCLCQGTAE